MYIGVRLAIVLESYGDESGTDDLSLYASFGGYLGDKFEWESFTVDWLDALRELKLSEISPTFETEFHTYQFYKLAKKANWPPERIDRCVIRLGQIIKDHTLVGFASMVSTKNYEKAFDPRIRRRRLKNRYYLLFEGALKMQWRYLYYGALAGRQQASFFFDEKKGFQDRALKLFDGLKHELDKKNLLVSREFVSSKDSPPIQAADFISYELRRYGRSGMHLSSDVTTAMNALKRKLLVHEFAPDELKMIAKRLETQMRNKDLRC